jgi:predicted metal-dependent hydrolase
MTPNKTMQTYQITIGEIIIDVVRKNIKNLHLAVYPPDGRVRIATPLNIDDEYVRLFAISKLPWIKKNQSKFKTQKPPETIEYLSGEHHYFQGKSYILNVIYQNSPQVEIRNNQYIDLSVKPGSDKAQRQKVLNFWYRQQLKRELPPLIAKWEKVINVNINEWGIKIMRTKWGTCNIQDKRIWLNLELIKKEPICLEYVIVHEITHLLERTHGAKFQALMDQFMPNWRTYKAELNRYQLNND